MEQIKQWHYRGSLKSCNYSCSYCPFSKKPADSRNALERDRQALSHFVDRMLGGFRNRTDHPLPPDHCAVQIVPYGEALIHKYYWQEMARLCTGAHIDAVGAQTNLSFNIDTMLSEYISHGGNTQKLRLWCTFHPEMTDVEHFASQCRKLAGHHILYCAGAVGNPSHKKEIAALKKSLDEIDGTPYLWINKMDGLQRNYTDCEREFFLQIDEYFGNELRAHRADCLHCGGNRFVEADGQMFRCNVDRRSIGNLYRPAFNRPESAPETAPLTKRCSCYLAYAGRPETDLLFFHPYPAFRIPRYPKAVFFDVDGTLVPPGQNQISEETRRKLSRLASHSALFAATSLPYPDAMRKLNGAGQLFSGGVFADGGMCRLRDGIQAGTGSPRKFFREFVISADNLRHIRPDNLKKQAGTYGYTLKLYPSSKKDPAHTGTDPQEYSYIKITLSFHKNRARKYCGGNPLSHHMRQTAVELGLIRQNQTPSGHDAENMYISHGMKITLEENCIQITSAAAGKREGILSICDHMGWKKDDIAVFGNSENDIPMLSYFPFSVAVDPSGDEVTRAAAYVIRRD